MQLHRRHKAQSALTDELATLTVLRGLNRASIKTLVAAGRVVHLPAGWALMSEDTPADSCYLLLEGSAEVRHGAGVVADLRPGALVGEAALVEQRRRNATVITTSNVRGLRLGYDDLAELFALHPKIEVCFVAEWEQRAALVQPDLGVR